MNKQSTYYESFEILGNSSNDNLQNPFNNPNNTSKMSKSEEDKYKKKNEPFDIIVQDYFIEQKDENSFEQPISNNKEFEVINSSEKQLEELGKQSETFINYETDCKVYIKENLHKCKLIISNYVINIFDESNKSNKLLIYSISLLNILKYETYKKENFYNYTQFEITLKDYRQLYFYIEQDSKNKEVQIINYINQYSFPKNKNLFYLYSFWYKRNCNITINDNEIDGWNIYNFEKEFKRQKVDLNNMSFKEYKNTDFKLCKTYPERFIIPYIGEEVIEGCANFRTKGRVPALTYRYKNSNCIWRSSQTNSGWNTKNEDDVSLIIQLCSKEKALTIYDARPWTTANLNRITGGGYENTDHYDNCNIDMSFCYMNNIHSVRNSLVKLFKDVINDKDNNNDKNKKKSKTSSTNVINYFSSSNSDINKSNGKYFLLIDNSYWYEYIFHLIKGSFDIAERIINSHSVLVHCTDGWDRTSQLCATSQLIIDAYYRTIEGFIVLIEKDFLSFGHQFGLRCGFIECDNFNNYFNKNDNQNSPIFLQWLDAIYQLLIQNITLFEFNINFLVFLGIETYNGKYGTFIFNNDKERKEKQAKNRTVSIWNYVYNHKEEFINPLYNKDENFNCNKLEFSCKKIKFWEEYFFKYYSYENIGNYYKYENHIKQLIDNNNNNILTINQYKNDLTNLEKITNELCSIVVNLKNVKDLSKETLEYINSKSQDQNLDTKMIGSYVVFEKASSPKNSIINKGYNKASKK